jgi:hypothetical protein
MGRPSQEKYSAYALFKPGEFSTVIDDPDETFNLLTRLQLRWIMPVAMMLLPNYEIGWPEPWRVSERKLISADLGGNFHFIQLRRENGPLPESENRGHKDSYYGQDFPKSFLIIISALLLSISLYLICYGVYLSGRHPLIAAFVVVLAFPIFVGGMAAILMLSGFIIYI